MFFKITFFAGQLCYKKRNFQLQLQLLFYYFLPKRSIVTKSGLAIKTQKMMCFNSLFLRFFEFSVPSD